MRFRGLPLLLVGFTLTSCHDQATAPAAPDLRPPEAGPTVEARQAEGYRTPGPVRTGWILGRNGTPMQITYEIQSGLAIWEGDIILGRAGEIATTREQLARPGAISLQSAIRPFGVVIDGATYRWPNGVVPYEVAPGVVNPSRIDQAIFMVEAATSGVTLVPRNGESDFVRFVDGDGCSSWIGRQGGQQNIVLASGCSIGSAAHEILHALGMFHEQSRCDRNGFVEIQWDEIEEGREHNFDRECSGASDLGDYDETSIMHYGPFAFAIGSNPTIVSLRSLDHLMGQRSTLSDSDVATINQLYGHNNQPPTAHIGSLAPSYPEGTPVPFDGSGSSDPDDPVLQFAWSFGDGTCSAASPPAKCSAESPSHAYAKNGIYTVTLTVSDGFLEDEASTSITVTNVAPTVDAGPDATANEGSAFTRSGSFTDPGDDTWTATVDYGEGAGPQALPLVGKTFQLGHTYVDDGIYTVTVTVSDDDGGVGMDEVEVTVLNVNPTVHAGPDASTTSGETYTLTGSFSDPGVNDAPWTYVVDWGFGSPTHGSTSDQSAPIVESIQVCAAGSYTVELAVTDKDGGTGTDALTLTVPYLGVQIDITPTDQPNPLNLRARGLLPVAVLSSATFDAAALDPATITLGDEVGADTPVARQNNGRYHARVEDVNGDGLMDLVVMFERTALVANGDLTPASSELVLRGFLQNGCTNVRGTDAVHVVG
jgi:PKD repeat protein